MKWLVTILLMTSMASFAGDKGNGGDGIERNGKLYVLDLVEAGVEEAPYFRSGTVAPSLLKLRLEMAFGSDGYPVDLIARKLVEIADGNPHLSAAIAQVIEEYNWRLVNSSLIDIKDEYTVLDYKDLKQLAIRKQNTISIDKSLWAKLDDENKTALIFHEVIYALIKPKLVNGVLQQQSDRAREVNGFIFTSESENPIALMQLMGNDFDDVFTYISIGFNDLYLDYSRVMIYEPRLVTKSEEGDVIDSMQVYQKLDSVMLSQFVDRTCTQSSPGEKIQIRDSARGRAIRLVDYSNDSSVTKYATYVEANGEYSVEIQNEYAFKDLLSCKKELSTLVNSAYEKLKERYAGSEITEE